MSVSDSQQKELTDSEVVMKSLNGLYITAMWG